jgi:peptide/nickel transport system substrate-binding protein
VNHPETIPPTALSSTALSSTALSSTALSRRSVLRRAGLLGLAGLTGPQLLAACSPVGSTSSTASSGATGSATPKSGGALRAALTGEPDSLDPAISSVYTGAQVYDGIFSKLVDIDASGTLVGDLAKSWKATDPKTWTFELVEGATFHNGEKFTSADVKYTFERILNPKTASAYAGLYGPIASVEATSPTTVVFHLKTPFGPFLTNLANNGEIVNQKAIESGNPARKPVGTGPFEFVEWVQGDHISLKRFAGYHKAGLPYLDTVTFKFLLVDQGRIDGLSSGELDWVDAVPLQQVQTLAKDPRFTLVTSPVAGIPDFLALNTKKAPFDRLEVRQAIAWAIDRKAIRELAYLGSGEVGVEEVPTGSPWYDGVDPYSSGPDVAKAKALLAQAGHASGLSFEYLGLPQYPELLKTGQVVRDQLKAVGIDMRIKQVDVSVWFDAFSKGDYQITSAYQERTIDPDNFYSLVLHSGGPINTTGYANKGVDALIDQAATLTDEAARKKAYAQIRQVVREECPLLFVHYETLNYLMTKKVSGSAVNPTLELNLGQVGFTA